MLGLVTGEGQTVLKFPGHLCGYGVSSLTFNSPSRRLDAPRAIALTLDTSTRRRTLPTTSSGVVGLCSKDIVVIGEEEEEL